MSDSSLTNIAIRSAGAVADLLRQERPAAAITLTRSSTLAITTAGTTITWQTKVRGQGITWSGTDITIPTAGYYAIQTYLDTAAAVLLIHRLYINALQQGFYGYTTVAQNYHAFMTMRYFDTGDVLQLQITPSANTTLNQSAETAPRASPFLHIVQLTGVVT